MLIGRHRFQSMLGASAMAMLALVSACTSESSTQPSQATETPVAATTTAIDGQGAGGAPGIEIRSLFDGFPTLPGAAVDQELVAEGADSAVAHYRTQLSASEVARYYDQLVLPGGWRKGDVTVSQSQAKDGEAIETTSIEFSRPGVRLMIAVQETKDHPDGATQMIVQIERIR